MKDIAVQLLIIFSQHSNTISRFSSSVSKWLDGDTTPEPEPPTDNENFSLPNSTTLLLICPIYFVPSPSLLISEPCHIFCQYFLVYSLLSKHPSQQAHLHCPSVFII